MTELFYALVAVMFTLYVIFDGFDLGAGALHLVVARTEAERRQVLAAVGPFWDGNEVWLLAGGGVLFAAFPRALAAGLSGFYFAIFLVLWCLILRGVAIEFRSHARDPLWRPFWDVTFSGASLLLAVFFGAALGNLLRGLPLDAEGWFSLALFTDFSARPPVGILDWYTVAVGAFALVALVMHGAAFLAWKTDGPVEERSRLWLGRAAVAVAVLWAPITLLTGMLHPTLFRSFAGRAPAWLALALAVAGMAGVFAGHARGRERWAFIGSSAFLGGLLAATAASVYPVILRAVGADALSLTARGAASDPEGLRAALGWWSLGFPLAIVYLGIQFRLHRGKARAAADGEGY